MTINASKRPSSTGVGVAHFNDTTNLCQKCFKKHLQAKREKPLSNVQWRQVVEKEAYRGRMWKMFGKEPYLLTGCCALRCAFLQKTECFCCVNSAGSVSMLQHLVPERIPLRKLRKTCFGGKNGSGRDKSRSIPCAIWACRTISWYKWTHYVRNRRFSPNLIRYEPGPADNPGWVGPLT